MQTKCKVCGGELQKEASDQGINMTCRTCSPDPSGSPSSCEETLPWKLIGGMVGVAVLVVLILCVSTYRSKKKATQDYQQLAKFVDTQIRTATARSDAFEFTSAKRVLDEAGAKLSRSSVKEYLLDNLVVQISDVHRGVEKLEAEFQDKVTRGWVVFEGEFISTLEKEGILSSRQERVDEEERRMAEAEQRRREEEDRRREAVRLAELRSQEQERQEELEGRKIYAYLMSQNFATDKLKAPSSARFPWYGSADVSVDYDNNTGKYTVVAWIEGQNSFGVYLRSPYLCRLWRESGDTWKSDLTNIISP